MNPRGDLAIISGSSAEELTLEISASLKRQIPYQTDQIRKRAAQTGRTTAEEDRKLYFAEHALWEGWCEPVKREITYYDDGEVKPHIDKDSNLRHRDVFVVTNTYCPGNGKSTNDLLQECLTLISAVKQAAGGDVTLILPYYSYSKQDRPKGKEPTTARIFADTLTNAGITGLVTMDLHADQIVGFFDPAKVHVDNIFAAPLIIKRIDEIIAQEETSSKHLVCVSPDAGGLPRANYYAKALGTRLAGCYKRRSYTQKHKVESMQLMGRVQGKDCLIIDDQIASGGTIEDAVEVLKKNKAAKIYVACTHAMMIGKAKKIFRSMKYKGLIEELITTNSITQPKEFRERNRKWFNPISIADFMALAIYEIHTDGSVSKLYDQRIREGLFP
jgi:ribose-phosphate pyrophosphokinase